MVEPLRHRQTKGAGTDMLSLTSPRHISTLPIRDVAQTSRMRTYQPFADGLAKGQIDRGRVKFFTRLPGRKFPLVAGFLQVIKTPTLETAKVLMEPSKQGGTFFRLARD